ncbi:phospholipid carrier-dependent glycosyltransferase [Leptolyngbya sp. KIOST-1]|uniref:phospholipid carrier-dependent glycosyltransferase n=1 Tax=Leptolyngbya sp. KIOST-1 TaxID=1229172 RepID=UPI0005691EF4|nr:phospholipid carrier-dependent glycosyltransferase [Leptolyngbya sp. KIOST-1]
MIRQVPSPGIRRAGILGLGAVALSLRLAGLGQPQAIVFDETYYVPFALDYLNGTPGFDAHPPLGKYLIAAGIWLGQWATAWLGWPPVAVAGAWVSPLAFRWLNAVVGATIPLLLAALAYDLSPGYPPQRRRSFALLAGGLMAMEGLTLVESRLALINIYGLGLGLLGQWAWVRARRSPWAWRWRWLAGMALGAAINVKWNWAGLWLGLLLWELSPGQPSTPKAQPSAPAGPLAWGRRLAYLGGIPLATYLILWLPHLALTGESLLGVHRQIWSAHQTIGQTASHAYCSPWYSWPLLVRPVAYFFERTEGTATTIHALGNPVLWWLGTAATLALGLGWLSRRVTGEQTPAAVSFVLINYLSNWLPWALVGRCTFFYHALGIATFSVLGLAWLMAQWWQQPRDRPLALVLLGAIALSFWFWLPLYLGLPLAPESLQQRWLLPGWI